MQYQIQSFKVLVGTSKSLEELIQAKFKIYRFTYKILSRSIDARNKEAIYYVYHLLIETNERIQRHSLLTKYESKEEKILYPSWKKQYPPVVVGFGPAGIFASLYLARCGATPIILERGSAMDERIKDVEEFIQNKTLKSNSNIQFGEGGAGTFSDGKLTTNVKNPWIQFIFKELVSHGANEDILYDAMPHVGTDCLRKVIKNIREEIKSLGGHFYFQTQFTNVVPKEDYLLIETKQNQTFKTKHLLLGIGHSAKDTIEHLYHQMHLKMEPKAFSMGVRVEHLASYIDQCQYGKFASDLPKAYYKLSCHKNGRGIYTFCMCPGGYVMASASDEYTIVTNGMSNQQREGKNSNSAILVDVRPEDYGNSTLAGLEFQRKYEELAFKQAGNYKAPANLMKEFMNNEVATSLRSVEATYPHGIHFCDLRSCLPEFVVEGIQAGILEFNQKLKGFYHPDAVLIGIESRSSSPVRILRNENRESSFSGIYPIGEGAGYAGGIISASLDGLLTAMKIVGEDDER